MNSNKIGIELKLKELDQLHNATLQFSNNSMELKKVFASILIGIPTFLYKINGDKLEVGKTATIMCISTIIFWILDSQNFYYQEKLRRTMGEIRKELEENTFTDGMGLRLHPSRTKKNMKFRSLLNWSNLVYIICIIIFILMVVIA